MTGSLRPDAPLGVVDIGSNSVRLVGYGGAVRALRPIYNERSFCRLGAAVAATGRIEGKPSEDALATLARFAALATRLGIENLVAFATAAMREAENREDFLAEAEAVLGHPIRVLSGREEALYCADGVMNAIPNADGIVADLGGGSLELACVAEGKTRHWATLPIGLLALHEKSGRDRATADKLVADALESVDWLAEGRKRPLYITGGTWRNLAYVHLTHARYGLNVLHHYGVARREMKVFTSLIGGLSDRAAAKLTASSRNRRAALPMAARILHQLLSATRASEAVVSTHAVREGVLHAMRDKRHRARDPLLSACEEMAGRLCKSPDYGHELAHWTRDIFRREDTDDPHTLDRLRVAACLISDLAWAGHPNFRAEMISQTVLKAPFTAIDHRGRVFLAQALAWRYDVGHAPIDVGIRPAAGNKRRARALGLSFRLAHALSTSLPGLLPHSRLKVGKRKLRLEIDPSQKALLAPIITKRLDLLAAALRLEAKIDVKKINPKE